MPHDPIPKLLHLASTLVIAVIATTGLMLAGTKPVLAEFEIKEAGIEKGEFELEYFGVYHWGLPQLEEGEVPLRQSHEFEFVMGITERWSVSTALFTTVPEGENWQTDFVALETQLELIERHGDGLGLAFTVGYGWATQAEVANEVEFGPIVELGAGKSLLTLNTFFTNQVGEFAETESLGFEYGWRAEYDLNERWGVGVEMFGEIEDLANAGSFDDQEHSIGPTVFVKFGGGDDHEAVGDVGEAEQARGGGAARPASEVSMNVGLQFGLTDVTSDTALKFQGALQF